MSVIIRLYIMLTAVSRWVEGLRVALLIRVYGIDKNEKPPIPWRKREGLPDPGHWPEAVQSKDGLFKYPVLLVGKQKAGPVKPVPVKFDTEIK
jgi:hypothetical protein